MLSARETARIFRLIEELGIALATEVLDAELMWRSLLERIEHRNGLQRVPMPRSIGNCVFVNDIARREIESSVRALTGRICVQNEPILQR